MDHILKQDETLFVVQLQECMSQDKKKLDDLLADKQHRRAQTKEKATKKNQQLYEDKIHAAVLRFDQTPTSSWIGYQAVQNQLNDIKKKIREEQSQAQLNIETRYTYDMNAHASWHTQETTYVENFYKDLLSLLSQSYIKIDKIKQRKIEDEMCDYEQALFNESERHAQHKDVFTRKIFDECRVENKIAVQAYNEVSARLGRVMREVAPTSYRMIAQVLGFDDISSDIDTYMCTETAYDALQPLLSYDNLTSALRADYEKHVLSQQLIQHFYHIETDDLTVDKTVLTQAVHSLDLMTEAKFFTHKCSFLKQPDELAQHTLYVDLFEEKIICTVLSSDGVILTKSYDVDAEVAGQSLSLSIAQGCLSDFIEQNTRAFVQDLYHTAKISKKDAFADLMLSVKGFKEHVIRVMATYNREMARALGFEHIKLTKHHIMMHGGIHDLCMFDTTPYYALEKELSAAQAEIHQRYDACCERIKSKYKYKDEDILSYQERCMEIKNKHTRKLMAIDTEIKWELHQIKATIIERQKTFSSHVLDESLPVIWRSFVPFSVVESPLSLHTFVRSMNRENFDPSLEVMRDVDNQDDDSKYSMSV